MELLVDPTFEPATGLLSADESKHCVSVMRHRAGDTLHVTDGCGMLFTCTLSKADSKGCLLNVEKTEKMPLPNHHLHMAVAPTKNTDRFEWFVEKATELGVSEITPLLCEHSERTHLRLDRLYRLVVAAAKQSLKYYLPKINEPCKAIDLINNATEANKYIMHCREGEKQHLFRVAATGSNSLLLIGPEGDFSVAEIAAAKQHSFVEATLGNQRLRTETAALAACHIIDLKNDLAVF